MKESKNGVVGLKIAYILQPKITLLSC